MSRILITGATGNVGRELVSLLADAGAPIRAMTRNPDAAALPPSVEVVPGDLTDPESLDRALEGVDAVFLLWIAPREAIAPAIERFAKQARRIVLLSAPLKTPHPLFQQPNASRERAEELERRIGASGLEWTFLRPGMLAANARLWWAAQIRAGDVVRWPYLQVPTAPIHERDIATVAARALREEGHAGAEYVLTGPQSLTQAEQVATIGRAIGRTLRVEEMSPEDARREPLNGWPPSIVNMLLGAWGAALGHPAWITSTFAEVTGSQPRTFFEWATGHAADFRP